MEFKTWLEQSNHQIEKWASDWQDQLEKGHPGHGKASDFDWHLEQNFPMEKLGSGWGKWMKQELRNAQLDGSEERYNDLMTDPKINEPIFVVLGTDGKYHVWDGNHRIGASALRGFKTIPAYVGVPK